jgi:hypothetical protein
MAAEQTTTGTAPGPSRATLGLTGLTINAMALIAPGAFLWLTYQILLRHGDQLRRALEAVPGRRLVVLLRRAGVSQ